MVRGYIGGGGVLAEADVSSLGGGEKITVGKLREEEGKKEVRRRRLARKRYLSDEALNNSRADDLEKKPQCWSRKKKGEKGREARAVFEMLEGE